MTTVNNVASDVMTAMNGSNGKKSVADEAQDRFMTLLVTQMKNQDPLNPLDNAQVTSQLAQLSTLTGIDKLNKTMESFVGNFQSAQALQATSMIGRGVLVPGSEVSLVDGKSVFGLELDTPADKLTVRIRDAEGKLVQTLELGDAKAGTLPIAWDGMMADGEIAPNGKYKIEAVATLGHDISKPTVLTFGEVMSVSVGPQGIKLNVLGVGEAGLGDVRQIL